jgi:hypothetical protein
MKVEVLRLKDDGNTTVGVFMVDGSAFCGTIEDEGRKEKVKGETRIPNGTYNLSLRNEGGYNNRYIEKYGDKFHKGMLCIWNKDNWIIEKDGMSFQYILIHSGNTEKHTDGCILPNYGVNFNTMVGSSSASAYKDLYPKLRDAILGSPNQQIEITFRTV